MVFVADQGDFVSSRARRRMIGSDGISRVSIIATHAQSITENCNKFYRFNLTFSTQRKWSSSTSKKSSDANSFVFLEKCRYYWTKKLITVFCYWPLRFHIRTDRLVHELVLIALNNCFWWNAILRKYRFRGLYSLAEVFLIYLRNTTTHIRICLYTIVVPEEPSQSGCIDVPETWLMREQKGWTVNRRWKWIEWMAGTRVHGVAWLAKRSSWVQAGSEQLWCRRTPLLVKSRVSRRQWAVHTLSEYSVCRFDIREIF